MRILYASIITIAIFLNAWSVLNAQDDQADRSEPAILNAILDEETGTISIFRENETDTLLVQNAQEQIRPFIHPIHAPDGKGILTEYRPDHHRQSGDGVPIEYDPNYHTHQTGLYWGLKRVNERDYFATCCKPGTVGYHRKVSATVSRATGETVTWQTVYDLLDETDQVILTETQNWSLQQIGDQYFLDLEWIGEARSDVTVGEFFVGGLFLRMPWYDGIAGESINASGQANHSEAEGQRSIWVDTGMEIDGRDDWGHIAIFDHPDNNGFPIPWRVDYQLGVGPSRQIISDWSLDEGQTEVARYRMLVYTGERDPANLTHLWTEYAASYEN